ncbi:BAG family molecular chaperone regulator 4 [Sesamum alatum]|uniref:BAG family molecular chaperone regulator 4 n=1 Tax=Sesamum alatum TaxID=300844 RepID=A0AAE2CRX1_9LAMI|nr:BAG family molecular chaperone regulator 4 [Sesamum alatum]
MKNLNPSQENCRRRNGVIGLGLLPGQVPSTVNIKVSHGLNQYEVTVPSNSSFGYLKCVIAQKLGLKPEMYKLFFRGKQKEDDEDLQTAGVKDNSEVLLKDYTVSEQTVPQEVQETCVFSKGGEAVAEVRREVDKLEQQVLALQAVVDSGKKVDNKEIIYLSEMLMRQLLKLDGIEAEGEGRVQRKMEVRRVQSLVDTLDVLKSRNSNASNNVHEIVSSTTQRGVFNPRCPSFAMPSSATPYVAHSTVSYYVPYPTPSSTPSAYAPYPPMLSSAHFLMPSSS